jgi:hypothetical protein
MNGRKNSRSISSETQMHCMTLSQVISITPLYTLFLLRPLYGNGCICVQSCQFLASYLASYLASSFGFDRCHQSSVYRSSHIPTVHTTLSTRHVCSRSRSSMGYPILSVWCTVLYCLVRILLPSAHPHSQAEVVSLSPTALSCLPRLIAQCGRTICRFYLDQPTRLPRTHYLVFWDLLLPNSSGRIPTST